MMEVPQHSIDLAPPPVPFVPALPLLGERGGDAREVVRVRRVRLTTLVRARRVLLYGGVLAMTVGSAILAKEVRSAPALAGIRMIVTEPSERAIASIEHAPDAQELPPAELAGATLESEQAAVASVFVSVEPEASDIPHQELTADELALATWGDLVRDPDVRWFEGRPIRPSYTLTMKVTAYSPDERSCGTSADGITATLHSVDTNGHCLVAADPKWLPMGTLISVPGYDETRIVPVLDVGGAVKGRHIDVLFPTHDQARKWGVQKLKVTVWEYADGKPVVSPRKLR